MIALPCRSLHTLIAIALLMADTSHAGLPIPNQPPVITASAARTEPFVAVAVPVSVADPDAGSTALTVTIALQPATSRTPAQVGRFTWSRAAVPVTTDTETLTLTQLNQALATLQFESIAGFAGRALLRIEVNDNRPSPPGVDIETVQIDVCGAADTTLAQCETNSAPRNLVDSRRELLPSQPATIASSVEDGDVGAGTMEMEITLADHPGGGEPVTPVAQIGSFSWRSRSGLVVDEFIARKSVVNGFLADLQFQPHPDFVGTARLVYEIDDRGNSRLVDTGSPNDILADTDFLVLRVCGRDEHDDDAACLRNDAPSFDLPPTPRTSPRTPIALDLGVDDVDVGGRNLDLSITVSDFDGVLAASSVGRFTWAFGTNVTSDSATASLSALDAALSGLVFTPTLGFAGRARLTLVIDDNGGTGSGGIRTTQRTLDIDVCSSGELGEPACRVNDAPGVTLGFMPDIVGATPTRVDAVIADPDAGAAIVSLSIAVSDSFGIVSPGEVGTLSWSAGPASTQLAEVDTLAGLRDTLDTLRFTPAPGFEGRARLDAVIDDLGNSGSGGAKSDSDTRLVNVGPAADIVRYDGACLLAVAEGGTLRLAFAREGGQGQANLSFESGGGSAMPGVDYPLDPPLTLSWTFAETGVKSLVLPITQDAIAEGSEDFVLVAGATGGFTYVGAPVIGVNIRTALGTDFIFGDGAEGECLTN